MHSRRSGLNQKCNGWPRPPPSRAIQVQADFLNAKNAAVRPPTLRSSKINSQRRPIGSFGLVGRTRRRSRRCRCDTWYWRARGVWPCCCWRPQRARGRRSVVPVLIRSGNWYSARCSPRLIVEAATQRDVLMGAGGGDGQDEILYPDLCVVLPRSSRSMPTVSLMPRVFVLSSLIVKLSFAEIPAMLSSIVKAGELLRE